MKLAAWFFIGSCFLLGSVRAQDPAPSAGMVLVIKDAAGVGLHDPTPVKPSGGNPGTTLGDQRRIAYQFALDLWSAVLRTPVPIHVQASFTPLQCNGDSDPIRGINKIGNAENNGEYYAKNGLPKVAYYAALANALEGEDLDPNRDEITSRFNSSFGGKNPDGTDCVKGSGWYYGLDGHTPEERDGFVNVVMHEISHGLGFSGDASTDLEIFSHLAYDNVSKKSWTALKPNQRNTAKTGGNVVFKAPTVQVEVPLVLRPRMLLRFSGNLSRDIAGYGTARFGPPILPGTMTGRLVMVNDGAGDDHADACEPLVAGSLTGKVAFANRGSCDYELKARVVQDAGAVGLIIGNVTTSNNAQKTTTMPHSTDPLVRANIPVAQLALADANDIRKALAGDITVQALDIPGRYQGADDSNYPKLYAPTTFEQGSSFKHFDTSASPNLLLGPEYSTDLMANVSLDLTPALLADLGWKLNPGNGMIGTCDTGIRAVVPGGKIIGANVQAYARVCQEAAGNSRSKYLRCMTDHAMELKDAKLIDTRQMTQIRTCAAQVPF
jgi:hypothetical protein